MVGGEGEGEGVVVQCQAPPLLRLRPRTVATELLHPMHQQLAEAGVAVAVAVAVVVAVAGQELPLIVVVRLHKGKDEPAM